MPEKQNCPVCGTPCTIEGNVTKNYVPVWKKNEERQQRKTRINELIAIIRDERKFAEYLLDLEDKIENIDGDISSAKTMAIVGIAT